jgi:hypothetical protein
LKGNRTHIRWKHQGKNPKGLNEGLSLEIVFDGEEGQRQADQASEEYSHEPGNQAVQEGFLEEGPLKKVDEMVEGEVTSLSESNIEDTDQRVKDKQEKEPQKDKKDERLGEIKVFKFILKRLQ